MRQLSDSFDLLSEVGSTDLSSEEGVRGLRGWRSEERDVSCRGCESGWTKEGGRAGDSTKGPFEVSGHESQVSQQDGPEDSLASSSCQGEDQEEVETGWDRGSGFVRRV